MSHIFNPIVAFGGATIDAFGRQRTSTPYVLFESKQLFNNQPLFWDEALLAGGTGIDISWSKDRASSTITSTEGASGVFIRQTYQRFNYQPGKSMLVLLTGVLGASGGGAGIYRRAGYFDDNNGIFFEDKEGTICAVRRSYVSGSPVDESVAQSEWNIDKMDGTGPSGVTLDATKAQIIVIDFEWLGVGRVRMGFNIDGNTYYVHEFLHANRIGSVYMSTCNLPLRYEMEVDPGGAPSSLECICATVASEGGQEDVGSLFNFSTATTQILMSSSSTLFPVVGVRLKADRIGADINFIDISLIETTGDKAVEWLFIRNPTISGTFTYNDIADSQCQGAIGATATLTGGQIMAGGFFSSGVKESGGVSSALKNAVKLGAAIDGTRDEFVLAVRTPDNVTTQAPARVHGSISWRESP